MKYALIGCGRISSNHIRAALENGLEIVAVCDLLPESMEALLVKRGIAGGNVARYTDCKQMLSEHPELELVAIATSSGAHAAIARDCIERGISVIIEKPVALSMADADGIVSLAREKGVAVCACHQNRFNLAVRQMRESLEAGRFGKISHGSVQVRWHRAKEYFDQAAWRGTWAEDGGCLMNQCIHGIDLLRWMMGDEVDTVYGVTCRRCHPYIECEDIGMAVVTFKNGTVATVEGTTNVAGDDLEETLCLFGEKGTVKLGGKSANKVDLWQFTDVGDGGDDGKSGDVSDSAPGVYGNGHSRLYADVIDAIKTGRAPYVDAVAGRNALELVLAIYKSAAEGRPVKLPLTDCATTDFCGRFGE